MSRNTKIILAVVVGLVVVCMCAGASLALFGAVFFSRVVTSDPRQVAAHIADFNLPPGYQSGWGLEVGGVSIAGFDRSSDDGHLMFIQLPPGANRDAAAMERQLRQNTGDRKYNWSDADMRVVGKKTATIRGQQVEMTIGEGANRDGQTYRQLTGVFQGKGGPAMLLITGPAGKWDEAEVDAFLASMQ